MCKMYKKTPGPEAVFDKVTGLQSATSLIKRLRDKCFSLNFLFFFTEYLQLIAFSRFIFDLFWPLSKELQDNRGHRFSNLYINVNQSKPHG